MQLSENSKRIHRSKAQKLQLLNELNFGQMTISTLARKYSISPITIYKWKRDMSQEIKKDSIDVEEILKELEKIKLENLHLKKALGNVALDNEILKTAVDVLKKTQRSKKLIQHKK